MEFSRTVFTDVVFLKAIPSADLFIQNLIFFSWGV